MESRSQSIHTYCQNIRTSRSWLFISYLLVRLVEVEDVEVAETEAVSCPELWISNFFVLYTDLLKFGLDLDRDFTLYEVGPLESIWAFHFGD